MACNKLFKEALSGLGNKSKWLGNSKEVPELYHGTSSDIKQFDPTKTKYSVHNVEGIYTSTDAYDASRYAGKDNTYKANVMPLVGRDKNMLDVKKTSVPLDVAKKFDIPDYKLYELKLPSGRYNLGKVLRASNLSNKENTKILKEFGATGLKDGPHYIFFNPEDLKSQFNSGKFSESGDLIAGATGTIGATALANSKED